MGHRSTFLGTNTAVINQMIACEAESGNKTTIEMKEAFEALSLKVENITTSHLQQITLTIVDDGNLMKTLKKYDLIHPNAGSITYGVKELKKLKLSLKDIFQKQITNFSKKEEKSFAASA